MGNEKDTCNEKNPCSISIIDIFNLEQRFWYSNHWSKQNRLLAPNQHVDWLSNIIKEDLLKIYRLKSYFFRSCHFWTGRSMFDKIYWIYLIIPSISSILNISNSLDMYTWHAHKVMHHIVSKCHSDFRQRGAFQDSRFE